MFMPVLSGEFVYDESAHQLLVSFSDGVLRAYACRDFPSRDETKDLKYADREGVAATVWVINRRAEHLATPTWSRCGSWVGCLPSPSPSPPPPTWMAGCDD
jgi:hypothetical protein